MPRAVGAAGWWLWTLLVLPERRPPFGRRCGHRSEQAAAAAVAAPCVSMKGRCPPVPAAAAAAVVVEPGHEQPDQQPHQRSCLLPLAHFRFATPTEGGRSRQLEHWRFCCCCCCCLWPAPRCLPAAPLAAGGQQPTMVTVGRESFCESLESAGIYLGYRVPGGTADGRAWHGDVAFASW